MTIADLKPYGSLLSICGTLLIFFSWLATNTLGERFKRAKAAHETASDKRRLYHMLDEIHMTTESVAAEIINLRREFFRSGAVLDPRRDERAVRNSREHDRLLLEYASTALNARQIDRGRSFCDIVLGQSETGTKSSVGQKQLLENCASISSLLKQKNAIIEQMLANLVRYTPSGKVALQDVEKEQRRLHDAYREILPSFGPLLKAAVDASNARESELRREFSEAKARSTEANKASLYLYIIGSALVLIGTVLDKLVK